MVMSAMLDKKGLKQLKRIENELEEIKERSSDPKRTFLFGILYGAGAFVGGLLAIVLLGWALSIAGLIPGLSEISHTIQTKIESNRQ